MPTSAMSDFTNLASALGQAGQSLVSLRDTRVSLAEDAIASRITTKNAEFLQRLYLPDDDPNKIRSDNWREALTQYDMSIEETLASVKSKGIESAVRARLEPSTKDFMLKFSGKLYEMEQAESRSMFSATWAGVEASALSPAEKATELRALHDKYKGGTLFTPEEVKQQEFSIRGLEAQEVARNKLAAGEKPQAAIASLAQDKSVPTLERAAQNAYFEAEQKRIDTTVRNEWKYSFTDQIAAKRLDGNGWVAASGLIDRAKAEGASPEVISQMQGEYLAGLQQQKATSVIQYATAVVGTFGGKIPERFVDEALAHISKTWGQTGQSEEVISSVKEAEAFLRSAIDETGAGSPAAIKSYVQNGYFQLREQSRIPDSGVSEAMLRDYLLESASKYASTPGVADWCMGETDVLDKASSTVYNATKDIKTLAVQASLMPTFAGDKGAFKTWAGGQTKDMAKKEVQQVEALMMDVQQSYNAWLADHRSATPDEHQKFIRDTTAALSIVQKYSLTPVKKGLIDSATSEKIGFVYDLVESGQFDPFFNRDVFGRSDTPAAIESVLAQNKDIFTGLLKGFSNDGGTGEIPYKTSELIPLPPYRGDQYWLSPDKKTIYDQSINDVTGKHEIRSRPYAGESGAELRAMPMDAWSVLGRPTRPEASAKAAYSEPPKAGVAWYTPPKADEWSSMSDEQKKREYEWSQAAAMGRPKPDKYSRK